MTMQPKFRVTDAEEKLLVSAARTAGLTVSAFAKHSTLQAAGAFRPVPTSLAEQVNEQLGAQVLTSASGKRMRVVSARVCPQPGCIWRAFGKPEAICPTHGTGVDQ